MGGCKFFFKDKNGPSGEETINRSDAAVPSGSGLVFRSTQVKCVANFIFAIGVRVDGKINGPYKGTGSGNREGMCIVFDEFGIGRPLTVTMEEFESGTLTFAVTAK